VDLRAGLDDLEKKIFLTLPGLELRDPSVVQLVASSYTDYVIKSTVILLRFFVFDINPPGEYPYSTTN
jgi:hypothetical protein